MRVILASQSERRLALLRQIGIAPEIRVPSLEEEAILNASDNYQDAVQTLARAKAEDVIKEAEPALVVAADTIVVLGEMRLGKPQDAGEARNMLAALSGKTHRVITGIALINAQTGRTQLASEVSCVIFKFLDDETIARYVATGEPMDKAGAYGIQEKGAILMERIEGSYTNIVGLPLERLADMLSVEGVLLP